MKPVRQVAAAELMVSSHVYSERFAQALLAGTSSQMLAKPVQSFRDKSLSADQRARLVAETDSLLENVKAVEARYGEEALTLSVCCRYVEKLLKSKAVVQYLTTRHSEVLGELQSLVASFLDDSRATVAAQAGN